MTDQPTFPSFQPTFPFFNGQAMPGVQALGEKSTKATSEMMALASRRMAAWSDQQKRLTACKQPADYAGAAQAFWSRTAEDYAAFGKAWMGLWTGGLQTFTQSSAGQTAEKPARDVLSFRDDAAQGVMTETDPRRADIRNRAA